MEYNEVRENKIKNMIICLTSRCNLSCKHCYQQHTDKIQELDLDQLQWIKDTFDIKNVNLMGGEPFMYPHLEKAIEMFDRITLTTNGVFLASGSPKIKKYLELFKSKVSYIDGNEKKNFSVQLSIEAGPDETDELRGPGVWRQVLKAAKLLKDNKIDCYFRCSYHEQNLHIIPELIDHICHPSGIPLVLFPRIDKSPLTAERQIALFNLIIEKNKEFDGRNLVAQPNFTQFIGKQEGRCEAGSERLCIHYTGDIAPCHLDFNYILGKVGMNLKTINRSREMFLSSAKKIQPDCNYCKHASICRSGCYVAQTYSGCPLKYNYDISRYAFDNRIEMTTLSRQISGMKDLLKDSLIC